MTSLFQLGSQAIFRYEQRLRFEPDLCEPWRVHFRWFNNRDSIHNWNLLRKKTHTKRCGSFSLL